MGANEDLLKAVVQTDKSGIEIALSQGADVNCVDATGTPAVILAVKAERLDILKILVRQKARLWVVDANFKFIFIHLGKSQSLPFKTNTLALLAEHWQSPTPTEVLAWAKRCVIDWPQDQVEQGEVLDAATSKLLATNVASRYKDVDLSKWIGHLNSFSGEVASTGKSLEFWDPKYCFPLRARVLLALLVQSIRAPQADPALQALQLAKSLSQLIEAFYVSEIVQEVRDLTLPMDEAKKVFAGLSQHLIGQCQKMADGESYFLVAGWFKHIVTLQIKAKLVSGQMMLDVYIINFGTGSQKFHEKTTGPQAKLHPYRLTRQSPQNTDALVEYLTNAMLAFTPSSENDFNAWMPKSSKGLAKDRALAVIYDQAQDHPFKKAVFKGPKPN